MFMFDLDQSTGALFHESVEVEGSAVRIAHDLRKQMGGTCGSVLWTASLALVGWLSAEPSRRQLIADHSVVELGAGVGFVGTCLRRMGARQVLVTDVPRQLPILRRNLLLNSREEDGDALQCCGFVWGERPRQVFGQPWDLIVACDVCYNVNHVPDLADALAALLERDDAGGAERAPRALLALPDREDFGFHLRDDEGVLNRKFDYDVLLRDLRERLRGKLQLEVLDTISTAHDMDQQNNVVLFLLQSLA